MARALALLALLVSVSAHAQSAHEWRFRGDFWSERNEHAHAAAAYENAITADPSLRASTLPKLARQLLWNDQPAKAVDLFAEHLASQPADCEARNDLGLALAWSDRLTAALEEYERVIASCAPLRNTARLRAAMAARWQDRPSLAEDFYRQVETDGAAEERAEARIGLAHILLMRGENRRARETFDHMAEAGMTSAASEGAAIASARLGAPDDVARRVAEAEGRGPLSRDFRDLRENLESADRFEVRPAFIGFHDADGTDFSGAEVALSRGWQRRGRGGIVLGRSSLSNEGRDEDANWLEMNGEHRASEELAGRAAMRVTSYDGWSPFTGEARVVWTPSDRWRFDGTVARVLITDNLAAIENELIGDFISAGVDRRMSRADTLVIGADLTRWSEGNQRTRLFLNWRHGFEGVPRLTVEWPTLLQRYDEPFSFGLFSPREYVETGPGFNLYRRYRRVWNASMYVRAGAQREDAASWRALGIARVALERDLRDLWAIRASAGWSNSNVTGSGGFRRSSVNLEILKRF